MYERKTRDRWDLMSNYGYGWECECSDYTYAEARQTLKEYRENGNGNYRIEKHREKIEEANEYERICKAGKGFLEILQCNNEDHKDRLREKQ